MAQGDGSRNAIMLLVVLHSEQVCNTPLGDHHCVLWLSNQQLQDHHLTETGPTMIRVGVLTIDNDMSEHPTQTHKEEFTSFMSLP